jgi:FecR protein
VNALRLFVSRYGFPALPTPVRGSSPGDGRAGALRRRPVWLLCGLLLVAGGAPASGFDGAQPAKETAQDLFLDSSGVPASANWVVLDANGIAAWRAQGETRWHRFTRGEVLPPGSEIETGPDGEITLVAGGDQLTIAPRGRLIVPFARPGQDRRLRHERGRILVQIESRRSRDVRVDTPLLSLGIKGTTIEVEVDPEQNSVVVHDGEVEVTTPGEADPVDLGAGEGLRQSVVPGADATRFTLPDPDAAGQSTGEPAWRLPPVGANAGSEPQTVAPISPSDSAGAASPPDSPHGRGGPAAPRSPRTETDVGWLDELASSWGYVAIAGVAFLILTIPCLALLQNLRQQWRSRPRAKGRRRRELVRG